MEAARVVIIGGGFGGLTAAKALARDRVRVTLLDRTNHHLFQPLLYQVASAALSPADIASPIRSILARQKNVEVQLANVVGIDLANKKVTLEDGAVPYDYVILAAGMHTNYFGHDDWERFAPGLKSLDDAIEVRRRVLLAFERAERATNEAERKRLLTFVVIGGGRDRRWSWRGRSPSFAGSRSSVTSEPSTRKRRASYCSKRARGSSRRSTSRCRPAP